ncbi:MAG: hypothetical protein P1V19_15860, partial [Gimesia sp.]|nr:hypothetical protein [Gimesia sp.]
MTQLRKDLDKVSSVIRKKQFDEAEKMIQDVEERLKKLIKQREIPETSKSVLFLKKAISQKRHLLAYRKDPVAAKKKATTVSFVEHVAPIFYSRCVKCHADDPGGKLHLDTFAGMKRGGESGPLLSA